MSSRKLLVAKSTTIRVLIVPKRFVRSHDQIVMPGELLRAMPVIDGMPRTKGPAAKPDLYLIVSSSSLKLCPKAVY